MIRRLFEMHPVIGVVVATAFMGLVGWFELRVGKSRNAAYLTWGVAGISLVGFLILRAMS